MMIFSCGFISTSAGGGGYGRRRDASFDATVLQRVQALFDGSSQADPPEFVALDEAAQALVAALKTHGLVAT